MMAGPAMLADRQEVAAIEGGGMVGELAGDRNVRARSHARRVSGNPY
jgi:hypothetical protein